MAPTVAGWPITSGDEWCSKHKFTISDTIGLAAGRAFMFVSGLMVIVLVLSAAQFWTAL